MLHSVGSFVLAAALLGLVNGHEITGKARVIDGDTIEIAGERIRFEGIDAPEIDQLCETHRVYACGFLAMLNLKVLIAGEPVRCFIKGKDRYRRHLATCHVWGRSNLNADMVSQGWAVAYTAYSGYYLGHENSAREQRLGIWKGTFEMPWKWRREHYQQPDKRDRQAGHVPL